LSEVDILATFKSQRHHDEYTKEKHVAPVCPKLIIAHDVRGRDLLQINRQTEGQKDRRTDITTGLHIASFAITGEEAIKLFDCSLFGCLSER